MRGCLQSFLNRILGEGDNQYVQNMKLRGRKKISDGMSANVDAVVVYKECRKNHAASIGGYAVDGCCEFMPAGGDGTRAAFRCAACNCHRNFHRKVVLESETCSDCSSVSISAAK